MHLQKHLELQVGHPYSLRLNWKGTSWNRPCSFRKTDQTARILLLKRHFK